MSERTYLGLPEVSNDDVSIEFATDAMRCFISAKEKLDRTSAIYLPLTDTYWLGVFPDLAPSDPDSWKTHPLSWCEFLNRYGKEHKDYHTAVRDFDTARDHLKHFIADGSLKLAGIEPPELEEVTWCYE